MNTHVLRHSAYRLPITVYGPEVDDPLVARLADLYDRPVTSRNARQLRAKEIENVLSALSKERLEAIAQGYRTRPQTGGETALWVLSYSVLALAIGYITTQAIGGVHGWSKAKQRGLTVGVGLVGAGLGLMASCVPAVSKETPEQKSGWLAHNYLTRWF